MDTKYFDTNTRRVIGYGFGEKSDKKPYVGKCVDKLFIFGNFIPAMACLLRREAIEDIGLFNEKSKVGEDYEYWLRLTSKYSIGYVDKILCSVRRHEHNLTFKFLKQAYSNLLTIKNVLNCVPYLAELVGPKNVQKKMYSIYYRLGIYSILDGHRKRGRTLLGRAWRLNPNPFINKIWPYYSLSYFPWIKPIARVREGLRLVKRVLRRGC